MLYRKKRILAKIESTYGTDPSPDGSNAILTRNLDIPEPYGGTRVNRDLDRETLGNDESINADPMTRCSFEVEIAGAGAAGTVPGYGILLRACGMSETINAGTDVQYEPVSGSFESVTLHYIMDRNLHVMRGCRGTVAAEFPRVGLPFFRFEFWGTYDRPVAATSITPNVSAFQTPLPVNESNTDLTIGSYSPRAESAVFDLANNVVPRNIINFDEKIITDRSPTAQLAFEMPAVADKDVFADILESHNGINLQALQLVHGGTAGNIVTIDAPRAQMSNLSVADSDGVSLASGEAALIPSATGDDELKITVA